MQLMNNFNDPIDDKQHPRPVEEEDQTDRVIEKAWDDVTQTELNPEKVREARKLDITFYNDMKVYTKAPVE